MYALYQAYKRMHGNKVLHQPEKVRTGQGKD